MNVSHLFLGLLCAVTGWARSHHSPPLGLFVKNNTHWIPLSGRKEDKLYYLNYGNSSTPPTKFILEDGFIRTLDDENPQYVGIFSDMLVYGSIFLKTRYKFDHEMKLSGQYFYDRQSSTHAVIKNEQDNLKLSVPVEIYILPFDRYSYSPIPIAFPTQEASNSDSPLVFCVYFNDMMWPLSGIEDKRSTIGYFVREDRLLTPMEVSYKDTYISTQNTHSWGNVGFFSGFLSYGPGIVSYSWKLNNESKIENHKFYLCSVPNNIFHFVSVITVQNNLSEDCLEADVFLLQYDRLIGEFVKKSSMLK